MASYPEPKPESEPERGPTSPPTSHPTPEPTKISTPDPSSYYNPSVHHNLLGHISLGVRSSPISERFYSAILAPFGVCLIYSSPSPPPPTTTSTSSPNPSSPTPSNRILGYGFPTHPTQELLNIFERGDEARAPGAGCHVAFNAPSRRAVRSFWEMGVENGGTDAGEPGVRGEGGYFAAYLWDPDGFKVEAVFQGVEEGGGEDEVGAGVKGKGKGERVG